MTVAGLPRRRARERHHDAVMHPDSESRSWNRLSCPVGGCHRQTRLRILAMEQVAGAADVSDLCRCGQAAELLVQTCAAFLV